MVGVSVAYRRAPVLRDVDLTVRPGQFVAIVGGNGAGKTTLLRVVLGLASTSAGTVRLFGTEISSFREWHRIGYVPQRAGTSTVLPVSVDEVIRTGLAGGRRPRTGRDPERRARVDHLAGLLGLELLRRRRMGELSGGEQQRVLIARALVTAPDLLVLDEPTTGVDAEARSVLRMTLHHLVDVEGVAVIYVSHDPEGFAGLADRIIEVRAGTLADLPAADHPHLESEHPSPLPARPEPQARRQ